MIDTTTISLMLIGERIEITVPTLEGMKAKLTAAILDETTRIWTLFEAIKAAGTASNALLGSPSFNVDQSLRPLAMVMTGADLVEPIMEAVVADLQRQLRTATGGLSEHAHISFCPLAGDSWRRYSDRFSYRGDVASDPCDNWYSDAETLEEWQARCLQELARRYNPSWLEHLTTQLLQLEGAVLRDLADALAQSLFHYSRHRSRGPSIAETVAAAVVTKGAFTAWAITKSSDWLKYTTSSICELRRLADRLNDACRCGVAAAGRLALAFNVFADQLNSGHIGMGSKIECHGVKFTARKQALQVQVPTEMMDEIVAFMLASVGPALSKAA